MNVLQGDILIRLTCEKIKPEECLIHANHNKAVYTTHFPGPLDQKHPK